MPTLLADSSVEPSGKTERIVNVPLTHGETTTTLSLSLSLSPFPPSRTHNTQLQVKAFLLTQSLRQTSWLANLSTARISYCKHRQRKVRPERLSRTIQLWPICMSCPMESFKKGITVSETPQFERSSRVARTGGNFSRRARASEPSVVARTAQVLLAQA